MAENEKLIARRFRLRTMKLKKAKKIAPFAGKQKKRDKSVRDMKDAVA